MDLIHTLPVISAEPHSHTVDHFQCVTETKQEGETQYVVALVQLFGINSSGCHIAFFQVNLRVMDCTPHIRNESYK